MFKARAGKSKAERMVKRVLRRHSSGTSVGSGSDIRGGGSIDGYSDSDSSRDSDDEYEQISKDEGIKFRELIMKVIGNNAADAISTMRKHGQTFLKQQLTDSAGNANNANNADEALRWFLMAVDSGVCQQYQGVFLKVAANDIMTCSTAFCHCLPLTTTRR